MMRLVFHGAAREVGRSCIEVASKEGCVLLDCGLKITPHGSEYPIGLEKPSEIGAVFISHAHLDHTGGLPLFDNQGMSCPIFATKETKAITRVLLKDAFKIGKITHQHLGYVEDDIRKVLGCITRVNVRSEGSFGNIPYKFFDAGHIPGSASVMLEIEGKRLLYTGDINTSVTRLLNPADTSFPEIDVMICESTYGDRDHPDRVRTEDNFLQEVSAALSRGGSVIIPVFAIGRAQEILLVLARRNFGVPIYFDGMGVEATRLALSDPSGLGDAAGLKKAFQKVRVVTKRHERMAAVHKQCIIVTTSGMLTGGPIMHYLNYMHNEPRHSLLLTGYQGEETNGRLLLENGYVFIDGQRKNVKCRVCQFDFSAHAGMAGLKALVRKVNPGKVIFVHGESKSVENLTEWASAIGLDSYAPKLGDVIDI